MKCSCVQLTDLPNEILLLILKKLTRIEVLYSLIGVNLRLDQILKDPIFTEHLNLMKLSPNFAINPLDDSILDRLCSEILPEIHHKIKWLDLEPLSMENILFAADYPNLYSLSLFNIDYQVAVRLFGEETHLDRIFKSQIATLIITFADHRRKKFPYNTLNVVCAHVLIKFNNLRCLEFYPYCDIYIDDVERLSFKSLGPPTFFSSSLTTLHINVEDFDDCLYLLDGRFEQLHTLYVDIHFFWPPSSTIHNQEKLIHLKCFSLICNVEIMFYDESIVPLLHRMSNLEELFLNIFVDRYFSSRRFVDGNTLQNDIINHMPNLNQFPFSIHSFIHLPDSSHLPSNDDIQRTFKSLEDYQIVSYIDYLPDDKIGCYHIYSYPYTLNSFCRLTNNFPGGYFPFVDEISLRDHRPFEHEFFMRIAQAFAFLRRLTVDNQSPQDQQLDRNHCNLSMIDYTHLTLLDVEMSHYNYVEQFLDATKTCLGNSIRLIVNYYALQIVTNNFTSDATRINCAKVKYLDGFKRWNVPSHFYDYFPLLET